jgi:hypothetical protein
MTVLTSGVPSAAVLRCPRKTAAIGSALLPPDHSHGEYTNPTMRAKPATRENMRLARAHARLRSISSASARSLSANPPASGHPPSISTDRDWK